MIWTRRSFLQTAIVAIAGLAASRRLPTLATTPKLSVFDPDSPFLVYEIAAQASSTAKQDELLQILLMRDDKTVFSAMLHSSSAFRWVAVPGMQMQGQNLINNSSADLDVYLHIKQNGRRFVIRDDQVLPLDSVQPLRKEAELQYA